MDKTITISKEEYARLKIIEMKMDRLEVGGVDNWEWYGESLNPEGEPSFDDKEKQIIEEVWAMVKNPV